MQTRRGNSHDHSEFADQKERKEEVFSFDKEEALFWPLCEKLMFNLNLAWERIFKYFSGKGAIDACS